MPKISAALLGLIVCLPVAAWGKPAPVAAYKDNVAAAANSPDQSDAAPRRKNLLAGLGPGFQSPWWNQRDLLNSSAHGVSLALSIDATNAAVFGGAPIIFDPDSALTGLATVEECIRFLNHKNYLKEWKTPHNVGARQRTAGFSRIKLTRLANGEDTKNDIKNAIDNHQAVVLTYNYGKDDCGSKEDFFNLKLNTADAQRHPDDSDYDTIYDGDHTMCIVGYDDGDGTFIVQDSRSAIRPLSLPGMIYKGDRVDGTIMIPQDVEYDGVLSRSKGKSSAYRYEFFTLEPSWVTGDALPPAIDQMKMCVVSHNAPTGANGSDGANGTDSHKCYSITAGIEDGIRVADEVMITLSIPEVGDFPLYGVFRDDALTCNIPILAPDSMSGPIDATIIVIASDTSGNESAATMPFHFASGLPLPFFGNGGEGQAMAIGQDQSQAQASDDPPPVLNASGGPGGPGYPLSIPCVDLMPILAPMFNPFAWHQYQRQNCVAYASLVALSIDLSKYFGVPTVLDPNSTLNGSTSVTDYIASLNKRKYLEDWDYSSTNIGLPKKRYNFSNITINQIGNTGNPKSEIRLALVDRMPVIFVLNYCRIYRKQFLQYFWDTKLENDIFTDIDAASKEKSGDGHAMCITGYNDLFAYSPVPSFTLQNSWGVGVFQEIGRDPITDNPIYDYNRLNGRLRIPQNINYTKWLYHNATWPFTILGGIYRYEFYKLQASWKSMVPVEIHDLKTDLISLDVDDVDPGSPTLIGSTVNQFKLWIENTMPIASVSATMIHADEPPLDVTGVFHNNELTCNICFWPSSNIRSYGVFTVTVVDTQGGIYKRSFNFSVYKGWASTC